MKSTVDLELAKRMVDYLNELLELDRPAIALLTSNRMSCNDKLADHPSCQVMLQHDGFHVGMLGVLNGLCGIDNDGGPVCAVFENPVDEKSGELPKLVRFQITQRDCST